ncbi:hypothetical protein LINPERPRIM_LOCUS25325, partial [Linum perenne]
FRPGRAIISLLLFLSISTHVISSDDDPASSVYGLPNDLLLDSFVSTLLTTTGKPSYGSITDLEGIQVHKFFLWLDVDEIKVDLPPADSIYFYVGFINKKLDMNQVETLHSCRDGVTDPPCKGFWKRVLEVWKILPS